MTASTKPNLSDRQLAAEKWIKALSGLQFATGNFHGNLESGVALCMAVSKLQPGCIPSKYTKPSTRKLNTFQKIEKIGAFIKTCIDKIGVRKSDMFDVNDLFKQQNLKQVVIALENLSSTAAQKNLKQPFTIGLTYAKKNKRSFTEQQMRSAKNAVPQMNKGSKKIESGAGLDSRGIILQGSHK